MATSIESGRRLLTDVLKGARQMRANAAQQYPDDERNARSVEKLSELIEYVEAGHVDETAADLFATFDAVDADTQTVMMSAGEGKADRYGFSRPRDLWSDEQRDGVGEVAAAMYGAVSSRPGVVRQRLQAMIDSITDEEIGRIGSWLAHEISFDVHDEDGVFDWFWSERRAAIVPEFILSGERFEDLFLDWANENAPYVDEVAPTEQDNGRHDEWRKLERSPGYRGW